MASRAYPLAAYAKQPWRALFLTYQVVATALLLPVWALYYLSHSTRPVNSWSWRKTLTWRLVQHLIYTVSRVGPLRRHLDYRTLDTSVKGVWIAPCPDLVVGEVKEWAEKAGVESVRIPGYWLERESVQGSGVAPPDAQEKVLYALHGGAYSRQSAHPTDPTSNVPFGIMKHSSSVLRVLTLEYRLSKGPCVEDPNSFPAALLDAIAGYAYLVRDAGFDPSQIVVEGDSAGGNLALGLVRYLVENKDTLNLAPPSALVICSPWVDLSLSDLQINGSPFTSKGIDIIDTTGPSVFVTIDNFVGPLGVEGARTNRFISPATQTPEMEKVSYENFPRIFVASGGCEAIRDQIRVLARRMKRDLGPDVRYEETPGAFHDILVFTWFEPERTELLQNIARWIDR